MRAIANLAASAGGMSNAEIVSSLRYTQRNQEESLRFMRNILIDRALESLWQNPELYNHHVRVAQRARNIGVRIGLPKLYCTAVDLAAFYHDLGGKLKDERWVKPRLFTLEERSAFTISHAYDSCMKFLETSAKTLMLLRRKEDRLITEEFVPPLISCHHNWSGLPQHDLLLSLSLGVLMAADIIVGCTEERPYRDKPFTKVDAICEVRARFLEERAVESRIRSAVLEAAFESLFDRLPVIQMKHSFIQGFELAELYY